MTKLTPESKHVLMPVRVILKRQLSQNKWVKKVEDTTFDNYVSWLMIAASISLTNCPSIALATSFSKDNAPFGIQIVAPPHEEQKLINFAKSLEENINISDMVPININNENI